jgi:hypothetical protein
MMAMLVKKNESGKDMTKGYKNSKYNMKVRPT